MSESFICRRGGSGTPFAVIGVTYPEGSTCTCSDGTKTLTAKGTSGRSIFNIPYAATWTVTATNGEKNRSKPVSITAKGQVETVTVSYELLLYKDGNEYVTITTTTYGSTSILEKQESSIYMKATSGDNLTATNNYYSLCQTIKVDLAQYESVNINLDSLTCSTGTFGNSPYFLIGATSTPEAIPTSNFAAKTTVQAGTALSLDVSALNSEYYIVFGCYGVYGSVKAVMEAHVNEVKLG